MPYYLHAPDADPTSGDAYETRAEAYAAQQATPEPRKITFVVLCGERDSWTYRERCRFVRYEYIQVPWSNWLDSAAPSSALSAVSCHYPHLAIKSPGKIAYTPDDEYGLQDRQLVVRPGRYLDQFLRPYITDEQYHAWIAACRVEAYRVATTADEIERVYAIGPNSCMGHPVDSLNEDRQRRYDTNTHPVRAYGDSDLAVAYIGDDDHVSQRAVIWPVAKRYIRIYGTGALRALLEANGYTQGSADGARIRAICLDRYQDIWLMPYVDGISSASRDGSWFVLDDHGGYCTGHTHGHTGGRGDLGIAVDRTCERCEEPCGANETYCESCEEERTVCARCDDTVWMDRDDVYVVDGESYCAECYSHFTCCDDCSTEFLEADFPFSERQIRRAHDLTNYCADCAAQYWWCAGCRSANHHSTYILGRFCSCGTAVPYAPGTDPMGYVQSLDVAHV